MAENEDFQLPPLREDLSLIEGPDSANGSPTFSLFDPLRNQYFRIGWQEFEFLSRWQPGSSNALVKRVNNETTLTVDAVQLQLLLQFLTVNNLVVFDEDSAASRLHDSFLASKKGQLKKVFKSYLFFKIPLIQPDAFLSRTLKYVKPLISKAFIVFVLLFAMISLYLVSRQWDEFVNTFSYYFNFAGIFYFVLAMLVVKVLHELGHAYVATYYGCRVPSMGVVFLVFWPVLYTDTTDAYKLTSRFQRMNIAAAGIVVELILAVFATFLWVFLPDGPVRSAAFFVATVSWIFSLLINANPFLKFDGYYLFADWLNISNLQTRAFAVAKWQLRQWVTGIDEPLPYTFPEHTHNILVVYSFCTWVYRFFLMLGIAALLYYLFFKLLAIVLVAIAVGMFVVGPVAKELQIYWQRRDQMTWNRNTKITAGILAVMFILFVLPWKTSVEAPGLLEFQQHTRVYTPAAAQIKSMSIENDQQVQAGQVLMQLESPELDYKISQLKKDIEILEHRIRKELGKTETLGTRQADEEDLARKTAELLGLQEEQTQLTITAKFDGRITDLPSELKPGVWVKKNDLLFELVNPKNSVITAYVPGNLVKQLKEDKTARFYPQNYSESPTVNAKIVTIDPVTTEVLSKPYLASIYEGDLAVHTKKQESIVVKDAVYRVVLKPLDPSVQFNSVTRGTVQLSGKGRSLLASAWRSVTGVLIRESGF